MSRKLLIFLLLLLPLWASCNWRDHAVLGRWECAEDDWAKRDWWIAFYADGSGSDFGSRIKLEPVDGRRVKITDGPWTKEFEVNGEKGGQMNGQLSGLIGKTRYKKAR
jgi:hypothetical protein